MKYVQISEELFSRLCGFHILGHQDALQARIIRDELEDKLNRMQRRIDYIPKKKGDNDNGI